MNILYYENTRDVLNNTDKLYIVAVEGLLSLFKFLLNKFNLLFTQLQW